MIVAKTTSRTLLSLALSLLSVQLFSQAVPSSNFSLIRDAAQAIAAGDLSRAENELQTVLKANPTEYRAVNLLGIVRVQQHRIGEAEQLFQQAIKQRPDFASAHMDLGLLYLQLNRGDEAEPEFRETLRLDPSRMDARAALVKLYRTQAADAAH